MSDNKTLNTSKVFENLRIGRHVSKNESPNYSEAIIREKKIADDMKINLRAAQIFVVGPQAYRPTISDKEEYKALRKTITDNNIDLIVHASYLTRVLKSRNLGFSRKILKDELKIAKAIGAKGVNIHFAKVPPHEIIQFINHIENDLIESKQILYFETEACKPDDYSYESPEKLSTLLAMIKNTSQVHDRVAKQIGFCIDTAHIWSCGIDISTYEAADEYFSALPKNVHYLIHLNDNEKTIGKRPDIHENIGSGKIWTGQNDGYLRVLEFASETNSPVILERGRNLGVVADYMILSEAIN